MEPKKENTISSKSLKRGKRTYFFDVKEASNGSKYVKITESRFIKEGEKHKRNSLTLFIEDLEEFIKAMDEIRKEL